MAYDERKFTKLSHLKSLAEKVRSETGGLRTRVTALENAGAQANVLESVSVNGAAQEITNKAVNITVPTKVGDLDNDSGYQTETEVVAAINARLGSAYRAGGSTTFANLPELTEANLGLVISVTDAFTTTNNFIEGAGKNYPAGTSVVVVQSGDAYKYDVMTGFVDLSGYVKTDDMATDAEVSEMLAEVFGSVGD